MNKPPTLEALRDHMSKEVAEIVTDLRNAADNPAMREGNLRDCVRQAASLCERMAGAIRDTTDVQIRMRKRLFHMALLFWLLAAWQIGGLINTWWQ